MRCSSDRTIISGLVFLPRMRPITQEHFSAVKVSVMKIILAVSRSNVKRCLPLTIVLEKRSRARGVERFPDHSVVGRRG